MTTWAKAPRGADPADTVADRHDFLTAGLAPVRCADCHTEVLVRKASQMQTSVQWTSDPASSCPEFAHRVAAGEVSARIDTCPALRAAIEHAVTAGRVAVPDG